MHASPPPSFRPYLASTLGLLILGWGGLALVVFTLTPTVWARWLFFALLTLALTGTALPVVWFLNLRFPSSPPAEWPVIVRQASWFGVYGAVLAWLEANGVVTLWIALGWALGLIVVEYIIRMIERSRWRPPVIAEETPPSAEPPTSDD
ncbi:MAG: hypothetical protein ABWK53_01275 [Anaerolineales bacterium]